MSKKHYEAIARILSAEDIENYDRWKAVESITHKIADYFATDNPRFNKQRFLDACGIEN